MTRTTWRMVLGVAAAGLMVVPAAAYAGTGPAVRTGLGDPYYPEDGNGGYDVQGYDVHMRYDPVRPSSFAGDTTVTLRATDRLAAFSLDLDGFRVTSVEIDGHPARAFRRQGAHELVIEPRAAIAKGRTAAVRVRYEGAPTGSGWYAYPDGGAVALGEPHSATAWFPANDHPSDKATFRVSAELPEGWTAVSIGRPDGANRWVEERPVATYLTMIAIDRFTIRRSETAHGLPLIFAYGKDVDLQPESEALLPEMLEWMTDRFGPYPFTTAGATAIRSFEGDAPMALETQGRPTYQGGFFDMSMAHEMTHLWFGDSVSFRDWRDGCIAECFAQYANLLWQEHHDGMHLDDDWYRPEVEAFRDDPDYWSVHLYDPGPGKELDSALYFRGQMMLHALRRMVGEDAFWTTVRRWTTEHRYGNASFTDFEALAAQVANRDLTGFFTEWAHSSVIPSDANLYPGSLRP